MLVIFEAFCGGSHKQLVDLLSSAYESVVYSLPGKKWHWKMRIGGSALAAQVDESMEYTKEDILFATSTFSLCELLALRPNLQKTRKILYFHENQLNYPILDEKNQDAQYGIIQIVSCLAADEVWFNSKWNMNSFLQEVTPFINRTPDKQPKNVAESIRAKSRVVYYPIQMKTLILPRSIPTDNQLHILWNHRWQYDKDPDTFFTVMMELYDNHVDFQLAVLGEGYEEAPEVFDVAKEHMKDRIVHFGYVENKEEYYRLLQWGDICVSTAIHEFFGVSMIEAAVLGNYCICPNRLSYVELFPRKQLYNTKSQLKKMIKEFCLHPEKIWNRDRAKGSEPYKQYLWENCKQTFDKAFL